ncbi:S-adenosyl-L-methionine-dependent methyltransferase, partial [Vararia minispora EC-137]
RLDSLHRGLKNYMDDKLCLAPLGDFKPKKILELGCVASCRAIEAATLFPDADVLATDISPLPDRPLPSNMKFMKMNILEPIPLEPASYDLIHARFTFVHLPDPLAALMRVVALLRPGGWLLIEDIAVNADVVGDVPGTRAAYTALIKLWENAGQEPRYAARLADTLRAEGLFAQVDAHHVPLPIHPLSDDPKIRGLGATIRTSFQRSFTYEPSPALVEAGYTSSMHALRKEEMEGVDAEARQWTYSVDMYIVSAQKA